MLTWSCIKKRRVALLLNYHWCFCIFVVRTHVRRNHVYTPLSEYTYWPTRAHTSLIDLLSIIKDTLELKRRPISFQPLEYLVISRKEIYMFLIFLSLHLIRWPDKFSRRTRLPGFSNCSLTSLQRVNDACLYNVPTYKVTAINRYTRKSKRFARIRITHTVTSFSLPLWKD